MERWLFKKMDQTFIVIMGANTLRWVKSSFLDEDCAGPVAVYEGVNVTWNVTAGLLI